MTTLFYSVTVYNGDDSTDNGYSATLADDYSIIRDTISITQPDDFEGGVNLIQSELSKLGSIGVATVSPQVPVCLAGHV